MRFLPLRSASTVFSHFIYVAFLVACVLQTRCHSVKGDVVVSIKHVAALDCYSTNSGDGCTLPAVPPGSTYVYSPDTLPGSFTELKSQASLTFTYDPDLIGDGDNAWFETQASVTETNTLTDLVSVQGAENVSGGWLQFYWNVDGQQTLSFNMPNAGSVQASVFDASAEISGFATIDGDDYPLQGGFDTFTSLLDNNSSPLTGGTSYSATSGPIFSDFSTIVPWTGGSNVTVNFTLSSTVELELTGNGETPAFTADLQSDFSNTATIVGVAVLDSQMSLIPGATAFSITNESTYAAVPEPSSALCLLIAAFFGVGVRYRRSRGKA